MYWASALSDGAASSSAGAPFPLVAMYMSPMTGPPARTLRSRIRSRRGPADLGRRAIMETPAEQGNAGGERSSDSCDACACVRRVDVCGWKTIYQHRATASGSSRDRGTVAHAGLLRSHDDHLSRARGVRDLEAALGTRNNGRATSARRRRCCGVPSRWRRPPANDSNVVRLAGPTARRRRPRTDDPDRWKGIAEPGTPLAAGLDAIAPADGAIRRPRFPRRRQGRPTR